MCGGHDKWYALSSCEVNVAGEDNWSFMTSLPSKSYGVRGLTIDNRVFMTGEFPCKLWNNLVLSDVQDSPVSMNWTCHLSLSNGPVFVI